MSKVTWHFYKVIILTENIEGKDLECDSTQTYKNDNRHTINTINLCLKYLRRENFTNNNLMTILVKKF